MQLLLKETLEASLCTERVDKGIFWSWIRSLDILVTQISPKTTFIETSCYLWGNSSKGWSESKEDVKLSTRYKVPQSTSFTERGTQTQYELHVVDFGAWQWRKDWCYLVVFCSSKQTIIDLMTEYVLYLHCDCHQCTFSLDYFYLTKSVLKYNMVKLS